jgi:hypothetical protein
MPASHPTYHTAESISRWSLTYKIAGWAIGVYWFFQLIIGLLHLEDRMMALQNHFPTLPWYGWVILLLAIALFGGLEGAVRWNKNEIAPILGWKGSLQNDAFLLARKIRDFVAQFIASNGDVPKLPITDDAKEKLRVSAEVGEWGNRFTAKFRATLADEIERTVQRLRAEGVEPDFTTLGVLSQPQLYPTAVLHLAGLLMAGALSLTLLERADE